MLRMLLLHQCCRMRDKAWGADRAAHLYAPKLLPHSSARSPLPPNSTLHYASRLLLDWLHMR